MQSRVLLRAIADIVTQGGFRLRTHSKGGDWGETLADIIDGFCDFI